jgi:hypothetical protein
MARTRSSTSPKGGCENVRRGIAGQEERTHAPAGGGDADDEFDDFHLQSVSKLFVGEGWAYSYKGMSGECDQTDKAYCNRIRQRPLRL